jgi:hypothetical protein
VFPAPMFMQIDEFVGENLSLLFLVIAARPPGSLNWRVHLVDGPIQNVDKVIHVRTKRIEQLGFSDASIPSHDFH